MLPGSRHASGCGRNVVSRERLNGYVGWRGREIRRLEKLSERRFWEGRRRKEIGLFCSKSRWKLGQATLLSLVACVFFTPAEFRHVGPEL